MIPHILAGDTLMFSDPVQGRPPRQVSATHPRFKEILDVVRHDDNNDETWETLELLLTPVKHLAKILEQAEYHEGSLKLLFDPSHGIACEIEGVPFTLPPAIAEYALELHNESGSLKPLMRFIRLLADNPRREVIDELWSFLRSCGLCLTEDGHFLAYKNVREDFTSIFDSTTTNNPGEVVKMRRSDVQYDPNITCSSGLHFAAWDYLDHYSVGGKTVILKISPADVVSIPSDYNNMKGRACQYLILREIEQPEELKNLYFMATEDEEEEDDEEREWWDIEDGDDNWCSDCGNDYVDGCSCQY